MKNTHAQILTFSRRSDPAFHMDWLIRRIDEGFCEIPNPFSGVLYRVSLLPEDIALLTFWTKNPAAIEPYLPALAERNIKTAFFVTVTGYPNYIEAHVPRPDDIAPSIKRIAGSHSPDALWWRYDPVIFSDRMTMEFHLQNFEKLCRIWEGCTRRVIFSLAHIDGPYRSIRKKLEQSCIDAGDRLHMPPFGSSGYAALYTDAVDLFSQCRETAARYGISDAEVCCSPAIQPADRDRIEQGSCLSEKFLRRIIPDITLPKIRGTRKGTAGYADCSCIESRDIGVNGTCMHGCVYCYANRNGMNEWGLDFLKK